MNSSTPNEGNPPILFYAQICLLSSRLYIYNHWVLHRQLKFIAVFFFFITTACIPFKAQPTWPSQKSLNYLSLPFPHMRPQNVLVLPLKDLWNKFPLYPHGHCLSLELNSCYLDHYNSFINYFCPKVLTCPFCPHLPILTREGPMW